MPVRPVTFLKVFRPLTSNNPRQSHLFPRPTSNGVRVPHSALKLQLQLGSRLPVTTTQFLEMTDLQFPLPGERLPATGACDGLRDKQASVLSREEIVAELVLWTPKHGRRKAGRPAATYIDCLKRDTGLEMHGLLGPTGGGWVLSLTPGLLAKHSRGKPYSLNPSSGHSRETITLSARLFPGPTYASFPAVPGLTVRQGNSVCPGCFRGSSSGASQYSPPSRTVPFPLTARTRQWHPPGPVNTNPSSDVYTELRTRACPSYRIDGGVDLLLQADGLGPDAAQAETEPVTDKDLKAFFSERRVMKLVSGFGVGSIPGPGPGASSYTALAFFPAPNICLEILNRPALYQSVSGLYRYYTSSNRIHCRVEHFG
ncbi:hypothetical protein Bbelb_151860 [Branchiostoma belcheri]|nr:hypothetical protein Bbelb_151860 [Branchiostoma belcheri]